MKRLTALIALFSCFVLCAGLLGCALLKKHEHSFGEWEIQIESDCITEGEKTRKCLGCEYIETQSIDALGHTFGTWVEEVPASCLSDGNLGYYRCSVCEKYFDAEENELLQIVEEKKGHSIGEWETKLEPTCVTDGEEIKKCRNCEYSETRKIDALGHTFSSFVEATPASCLSEGTLGYYRCSVCEKYFDESKFELSSIIVEKKNHDFDGNICRSCGGSKRSSWGLEFRDKGDHYVVSGIGACRDTEIFIPCEYNGKHVTEIDHNAFFDCINIKKVTISTGITTIGENAFKYCLYLKSVSLPKSLTKIGSGAFSSCAVLENIAFPEGVTIIEAETFMGCRSFTNITLPEGVTSIGNDAFFDCARLESITIPDSVTSIGKMAFSLCKSLKSITIPDSVTSLGYGAFSECTLLESATLPKNLKTIEMNVFGDCTALTSVTLPEALTNISSGAFYNCTTLASIKIPNSVNVIYNGAFKNCASLTSITLPYALNTIGVEAFAGCTFTSAILPRTIRWQALPLEGKGLITLNQTDLESPKTLAKYLTETYTDYFWLLQ